jgi:hypothetical protein
MLSHHGERSIFITDYDAAVCTDGMSQQEVLSMWLSWWFSDDEYSRSTPGVELDHGTGEYRACMVAFDIFTAIQRGEV